MTTIGASSAVFKDTIMAYRSARQAGEMDHPAFMAAMQAYEGHQPGDNEAGRVVGLLFVVHVATERATKWFLRAYGAVGVGTMVGIVECALRIAAVFWTMERVT